MSKAERLPNAGVSRDPQEALQKGLEAAEHCRSEDVKMAYGTLGAPRGSAQTVVDFHSAAVKAEAYRVHIYDSMGIGLQTGTSYIVSRVKQAVGSKLVLFIAMMNSVCQPPTSRLRWKVVQNGLTWSSVALEAGLAALRSKRLPSSWSCMA